MLATLGLLAAFAPSARADLDSYVQREDASFAWSSVESKEVAGVKAHQLKLTSQTWQGKPWTHGLQIYEPAEVKYPDVMLLFITGGANRDNNPNFRGSPEGLAMAKACGARIAVLPQVPNQPLMGGRVEDDLIAETFTQHLATQDDDLPLLQPMVKAAVKAMDAAQEWGKTEGRPVPSKFVVTGASKRGWTTWLTGAVDKRVIAIAPMVIPTLNMKAQNKHQIDTWGKYSEQIEDYTKRGLLADLDKPERTKLWKLVDPYTYRDRLTMPKLQINGTNDPYWTLDSMNLYWDDLKGPSFVVYLPNAVHNLQEHRDWAVNGVGALFRHAASGKPMPKFSWSFDVKQPSCAIQDNAVLTVDFREHNDAPKSVRIWRAASEDRDFRKSRWEATVLTGLEDEIVHDVTPLPQTGYVAKFADLTYEIDGLEFHLSSQIAIFGPKGEVKP